VKRETDIVFLVDLEPTWCNGNGAHCSNKAVGKSMTEERLLKQGIVLVVKPCLIIGLKS
jgi:hypothetical protein